jgi:hypothetical protein
MRKHATPATEIEESEFEGLRGGKIKIRKAESGIVQFSSFLMDITNSQNKKIVFEGRVALDWQSFSELMDDHGQATICETLHPLGLYILSVEKRSQLKSDIKSKISEAGWKGFESNLVRLQNENLDEKAFEVFIVAAWVQLFEEPFQMVWLAAMAQHAYVLQDDYAFGYLIALLDQKKNSETHFLRGKETLRSAKLGGIAKSTATRAETQRTMLELSRLVLAGHTVARASDLAFKNGLGTSATANKKLWQRNHKK